MDRTMGDVRYQGSKEGDVAALLALHDAIDGRNRNIPWDLEADPKTWYGVQINDDGRVVSLELQKNDLQGKRSFSCFGIRFSEICFVERCTRTLHLVETTSCPIR